MWAIAGCGAGERHGLLQFQLHYRAAGEGQAGRGSGRDGAGAMVDTGKGEGTGWQRGEEFGRMGR